MFWPKNGEIYEIFTFYSADDEMKLEPVLNKFSEYCNPRKNVTILRHKFFTYRQLEDQRFHDFITELKKKLSAEWEFEILRDSLIKDMILCGTNDNDFCETLLRESDLILSRAISAGHAAEETRKHDRQILQSHSFTSLYKINKFRKSRQQVPNEKSREIIKKCTFCNGSHPRRKCPVYGVFKLQPKKPFQSLLSRKSKKGRRNQENRG